MIELTDRQIEYLLCIYDKNDLNLTRLSKIFNCSKVNSKNIIDRMIKLGIIYKENNEIHLTYVGEKLAYEYKNRREFLNNLLEDVLELNKESLNNYVNYLLSDDLKDFSDRLINIEKCREKLQSMDKVINSEELTELFKKNNIKITLSILKNNNSYSMAMKGFNQIAYIDIENKEIIMSISEIHKKMKGFKKKGYLKSLEINGNEIEVKEDLIKIPLNLVKYWFNLKNGVLIAILDIELKANISFNINHNHMTKFIFTINIFN